MMTRDYTAEDGEESVFGVEEQGIDNTMNKYYLKIAIYDEGILPFGISSIYDQALLTGIMKAARVYQSLEIQDEYGVYLPNAEEFRNLAELESKYPGLAAQIEKKIMPLTNPIGKINLVEVEVLDFDILNAFDRIPHILVKENDVSPIENNG